MCVALPGKVIEVMEKEAIVDFHGNKVTAMTGPISVSVGDYVLVHAGMILQKMNANEAEEMAEIMKEVGAM